MSSADMACAAAYGAAQHFAVPGDILSAQPYGTGHINDTFIIAAEQAGTPLRYIIQRINTHVFHDPAALMDNMMRVTSYIKTRLALEGHSDLSRRVLTVVPARDGRPLYCDATASYWRLFLFIEGCVAKETTDSLQDAFALGSATGHFQALLADFPGPRLVETIPNFHNARTRIEAFEAAIAVDSVDRAASAQREIEFLRARYDWFTVIVDALHAQHLPERITHNDTKMSNLLLDARSGKAICVIDLDTVMPGAAAYDFGDLVRTCAASIAEDDPDPSRMCIRQDMYEAIARGYASTAQSFLTNEEKLSMVRGGLVLTMLMAMRFLTDYLSGDQYYHIEEPYHNMRRCHTQLALIDSMEKNKDTLEALVMRAFAQEQTRTVGITSTRPDVSAQLEYIENKETPREHSA